MMSGLVAAVALGFVGGPSADGKAVTEIRLAYHRLIVGTWEERITDSWVVTWEFRRNGECIVTVPAPDGTKECVHYTYRVNDQPLEMELQGRPMQLLRFSRRVLVWRFPGKRILRQFRRR